jgi:hypothetical protein
MKYYIVVINIYSSAAAEEKVLHGQVKEQRRTTFDKKTGKAVAVTGPRDKPESVCIIVPY